jgi:hypothetical protein
MYAMPQSEEDANLMFQLYGFPPHFANTVSENFSNIFWVDRPGDGPISWPPTSPSLTPMRFYF